MAFGQERTGEPSDEEDNGSGGFVQLLSPQARFPKQRARLAITIKNSSWETGAIATPETQIVTTGTTTAVIGTRPAITTGTAGIATTSVRRTRRRPSSALRPELRQASSPARFNGATQPACVNFRSYDPADDHLSRPRRVSAPLHTDELLRASPGPSLRENAEEAAVRRLLRTRCFQLAILPSVR